LKESSIDTSSEYAEAFEFPFPMETGAPDTHVIANGLHTFLIYLKRIENDEEFFKEEIKPIKLCSEGVPVIAEELYVLIEFKHCHVHRYGAPNEEVLIGHPHYRKGLKFYSAHVIQNSRWIEELKTISKVHPQYQEENWKKVKHYFFTFHDEIFECIADSFQVVLIDSLPNVIADAIRKL